MTTTNRLGEKVTQWQSHKHPNNPDFMQVVKYMHIQYPDGRNHLYWFLKNASANDNHMIANITLAEAQRLYTDVEELALTEKDFEEWLRNRK